MCPTVYLVTRFDEGRQVVRAFRAREDAEMYLAEHSTENLFIHELPLH